MAKIVVTGANGFIGRALCASLVGAGYGVTAAVRAPDRIEAQAAYRSAVVGDIDGSTDWRAPLRGADAVIHLAAQAASGDNAASHAALWRVNVDGAKRLAHHAAVVGVRRLIYVSSIKVNGDQTHGQPFVLESRPAPGDAYARAKLEAEQALRQVAAGTELDVVLVRPPLVYGAGVKGNFLSLLQWIDKGLPLPLASVDNRRSLLALDNLVEFLVRCIDHTAAAGQTFLLSDGEDLSTPELLRRIAAAMDRRIRLWPVPTSILSGLAQASGRRARFARLCGSLQVDASHARAVLGWRPKVSVDQALAETVSWYKKERASRPYRC
jgi:nucleoside-diphosphate-sugar epimerase